MGATRLMAACALAWALVSISSAQEMRIQFAEPVSIAATAGNTQFDAFGRRFALTLEANDRLLKGMPAARKAALATTRLLRGSINGLPGSWVRLTVSGTNTAGAIGRASCRERVLCVV